MSADPGWQLRRATAADAAALSLVASACFLETFAGVLTGDDIVAHCAKANATGVFRAWAETGSVMIACTAVGGAPLGYSVLTKPDLPAIRIEPGDVELKRIYTLSRVYGTGLGGALMQRATDDARQEGKDRVLLGVYADNHRARRFYEKSGFVPVGERRFQVGATLCEDVIYAMTL